MSFVLVTTTAEVTALPDGTLISWLPVMDDPSSEAVAFVRKTVTDINPGGVTPAALHDTWIAPGNGWAPEPVTSIVFPARIILLGVPQPGDYVPQDYLTSTDDDSLTSTDDDSAVSWPAGESEALYNVSSQLIANGLSGGTYPRDLALQAAASITAQTTLPTTELATCADVTLQLADTFADWLISMPGQPAPLPPGYFAGGLTNA